MPIITGGDSEFGRLVVEEFNRRAQRVVDLGQAAPHPDVDQADAGEGNASVTGDRPDDVLNGRANSTSRRARAWRSPQCEP